MKTTRFALSVLGMLALISLPLSADAERQLRNEALDSSRRELLSLSRDAIPGTALGEWKDIAESAVFMLFRKTELFRGPMRVLVIDSDDLEARIYPEGTLVISSGLLDYIDAALFESAADSPRRMRNFTSEREAMLVPFIALEASRFALDLPFSAWCRSSATATASGHALYSARVRYSPDDIAKADRFAPVLLALADFDPESYAAWLSALYADRTEETPSSLDRYLASFPTDEGRIASISREKETIRKITGEFSGILSCIKTGTAYGESVSGIEALKETYPGSYYLARLEGLVLHRQWVSGISANEQILKTFFPFAEEAAPDSPGSASFVEAGTLSSAQQIFPSDRTSAQGDITKHSAAIEAYRKADAFIGDPTLESAYARLLLWSGSREGRNESVRICAQAAAAETGSTSVTARANYAAILYLAGIDTARATSMMEKLLAGEPAIAGTIPAGYPGDSRDLLVNLAITSRLTGNSTRAAEISSKLKVLSADSASPKLISWRNVRIGDSTDDLISRWGEPAEIFYNYYTENWVYPSLSASVLIVPDGTGTSQSIRLIRLGPHSPITPGGDIRTGDKKDDFEAIFGKPLWQANDCEVYAYRGNEISVFYLSGRIRAIIAGR